MVKIQYCWRCRMDVSMLEEDDWREIGPLMAGVADPEVAQRALDAYHRLTGERETNVNAIWHHKTNEHGPPCRMCGKPLRTDRASFCAACGAERYPSTEVPSLASLSTESEQGAIARFVKGWRKFRERRPSSIILLVGVLAVYAAGQAI